MNAARWMWPQTTPSTPASRAAASVASLISLDVALRAGEARLHVLRERPIRPIEHVVQPVHEPIQREQAAACEAAEPDAERPAAHDVVELVAVRDEQAAAVARRMDRVARDLDVAELEPGERVQVVIVVAGNVDDPRAFLALLQQQAQDLGVARGPVEALAQVLEVDDVADEIEDVTARMAQEVEQQIDAAFAGAQVDVGQPDGAERLMARIDSKGLSSMRGRRV